MPRKLIIAFGRPCSRYISPGQSYRSKELLGLNKKVNKDPMTCWLHTVQPVQKHLLLTEKEPVAMVQPSMEFPDEVVGNPVGIEDRKVKNLIVSNQFSTGTLLERQQSHKSGAE